MGIPLLLTASFTKEHNGEALDESDWKAPQNSNEKYKMARMKCYLFRNAWIYILQEFTGIKYNR